jgi:hypothetical protein
MNEINLIEAIRYVKYTKSLPYRKIIEHALRFELLKQVEMEIGETRDFGKYRILIGHDPKHNDKPYVQIYTQSSWLKHNSYGPAPDAQ